MIARATHNPTGLYEPITVDLFAGGGGASLGIEWATGRAVDVAVNHDPAAVAMHRVNHPHTLHVCQDVFDVDPIEATGGRPVNHLHVSPDCTYHSKARGGKPIRDKRRRDLAWVVPRWAAAVRPTVITLENVEEFAKWGPLTRKRGRDKHPRPCRHRKAKTFDQFCDQLRGLGYNVEHRELRACDYGSPTIRKRLFLVARCDGRPIVWPEPTHGPGLLPWPTAAECIDFTIPCPSIFERKRPLADNTLKRIANGIKRHVIDAQEPFIVRIGQTGGNGRYTNSTHDPLTTITTKAEHCLVVPTMIQSGYGERPGQAPRVPGLHKPMGTIVGTQKHALVAAFLARHFGGMTARDIGKPLPTTTTRGTQNQLVAAHLTHLYGSNKKAGAGDPRQPMKTVSAGGNHAGLVAALLAPYYGSGSGKTGRDLRDPSPTVTTNDRLSLITVHLDGEPYIITDIGMRMLQPRELFRAQGFPDAYEIEYGIDADGCRIRFTKTKQVQFCGNSVPPHPAAALVRANSVESEQPAELEEACA